MKIKRAGAHEKDIIFARETSALRFIRVKDERFMAVLPPLLHVAQQHFIKQFPLCDFVARSQNPVHFGERDFLLIT